MQVPSSGNPVHTYTDVNQRGRRMSHFNYNTRSARLCVRRYPAVGFFITHVKCCQVLTGLLSSRTPAAPSSCGWFSRSNAATGTANHAHSVPQQPRLSQETTLSSEIFARKRGTSARGPGNCKVGWKGVLQLAFYEWTPFPVEP